MRTTLIRVGFALNGLACLVFVVLLAYASTMLPTSAGMRVTDLDRAQVFNEERLRAYDPALAQNIRLNVAPFITQHHRTALMWALRSAVAASCANLLLLGAISRAGRPSGDTADPADAPEHEGPPDTR